MTTPTDKARPTEEEPYDDATILRLLADADQCYREGITPRTFNRMLATIATVPGLRRDLDAARDDNNREEPSDG